MENRTGVPFPPPLVPATSIAAGALLNLILKPWPVGNGWMIAGGLWKSRPHKLTDVHPWRLRRSGYGELVQWDTSGHDWLEGRGE